MSDEYRGRFAPSPTGPLHFGSLIAALASYLDARAHDGRWLVRMEDLDPPREMPGAAAVILRQLREHGLVWDGDVLYQSTRLSRYGEVLESLFERGIAYCCCCTRREVQAMGGVYDGRCYRRGGVSRQGSAVRVHLPPASVVNFEDRVRGRISQDLNRDPGDFVVRRRDGLFAYQLAVVVDDAEQGINCVIRGSDLLSSTARQIWLLRTLGKPVPGYGHIPVAINDRGQKLSKQTHAPSLDDSAPDANLRAALTWLGMPPSPGADISDMLGEAVANWRVERLRGKEAMTAE